MESKSNLIAIKTMRPKRRRISKVVWKKRLNTMKWLLEQNTQEFCKNSTLHGLNYLTNRDLYPLEKIFFGLSFIFVVLLSGFFILNVYNKWNTTPVIVSINSQPTYVTDEPFPAVTICNLNQATKNQVEHYSIYSTEYAMVQLLCKREANATVVNTITDWSELEHFIQNVSQPCSSMLLSCRFGAVDYDCSKLFYNVVTDEGLCCVFNMVHPSLMYKTGLPKELNISRSQFATAVNWNAETGYPKNLPKNFFPRTTPGTGESLGLSLTLDAQAHNYYCSSSNSIGFKIAMHSPNESPSLHEIGLLLATGRETKIRIHPEKVESEPHLRSIRTKDRKCVFQNEIKMDIFSNYTQRNCEIECVAGQLIKDCHCLPYYVPKLYGNETICSIYDITCVEKKRLKSLFNDEGMDCQDYCLPSCYELNFSSSFFSSPLTEAGVEVSNDILKNLSSEYIQRNIALVHMYFEESSFRSSKQTEFVGMTDFLSSVGGLIGLFFGFSFISFAEFIFYAMIRPWRAVRHNGDEHTENTTPTESQQSARALKRVNRIFKDPFGHYLEYTQQVTASGAYNNINVDTVYLNKEFSKPQHWYTRKHTIN